MKYAIRRERETKETILNLIQLRKCNLLVVFCQFCLVALDVVEVTRMRVGISMLAAKDIAALTLKLTCQCHLFSALPTSILLFLNFPFWFFLFFVVFFRFDALILHIAFVVF